MHRKRVKATTKRQSKIEAELLDHAANNLARALKQDIQKNDGRVNHGKVHKYGYNFRLLTRLVQTLPRPILKHS